jgi:methionyl-tRNA formyltransferase
VIQEEKSIVILTNRERNCFLANSLSQKLGIRVHLITSREKLNLDNLKQINPSWIFVPHWSEIITKEIHENFRVVIFHMTDLPFGRGGSPLQNLIVRGIENTVISAIQCTEELDAEPIYLKEPLNLNGTADEILIRASLIIEKMIIKIFTEEPSPIPQTGSITYFKRRKPDESRIEPYQINNLVQLYDFIRMLDGEGYPNAFLEIGNLRITFHSPHLRYGYIQSQVKIECINPDLEDQT